MILAFVHNSHVHLELLYHLLKKKKNLDTSSPFRNHGFTIHSTLQETWILLFCFSTQASSEYLPSNRYLFCDSVLALSLTQRNWYGQFWHLSFKETHCNWGTALSNYEFKVKLLNFVLQISSGQSMYYRVHQSVLPLFLFFIFSSFACCKSKTFGHYHLKVQSFTYKNLGYTLL